METLGLIGILALWGALGLAPGWALFAASRGRAPLVLPVLSMIAGIAGGALIPALGAKGWGGFVGSVPAAVVAGSVCALLSVRVRWLWG